MGYTHKIVNGVDVQLTAEEIAALEAQDAVWAEGALVSAKEAKAFAVLQGMEAFLSARCCGYCDSEKASWPQQTIEAQALETDPDAAAPLVRAIAASRGMPVADLAQRIRDNAETWTVLSGYAVGRKGALLDAIAAAQTVEAVNAVEVSYVAPEGYETAGILFQE